MSGICADNEPCLHSCQVEQVQLISPAQAEAALLTAEMGLTLLATDLAVRSETVGYMVEESVNFFNSSPGYQINAVSSC
ncbi:MAG: hypothetical protein WAO54_03175 [Eubacteriales bacterium]